jgi:cytoskeletal protein CcmA (bactofilin family)
MKKIMKALPLLVVLAILFAFASPVYAQGGEPGKIIFGDNFTLESGEELAGDLVVFGGNVTVEEDAVVNGSLVVFGGTVASDGTINGDVVIFGGQIKLDEHAVVDGDVTTIGGQVSQADGAEIKGDVVNNASPEIKFPNGQMPPRIDLNLNPFWEIARVFYRAVIFAALAMLVVVFLQPQMQYVGQVIVRQPVMAGGMGLLTLVGGPLTIVGVTVILSITIILIPVALVFVFIATLAIALAGLFGIIALGHEVGERFTRAINQNWTPVLTTGLGTFLVMLIGGAVAEIPCFGWFVVLLVGLVATGAVVMTRFGVKPLSLAVTVPAPPSAMDQPPTVS